MTWKIIQIQGRNMSDSTRKNHSSDHVLFNVSGAVRGKTGKLSVLGAVHKRRRQLGGGRGQKLINNCQRIVLKTAVMFSKIQKNCRRHLWMVPNVLKS